MTQRSSFPDGSYVLHKIPVSGKFYSAWFDNDGTIKDAERSGGGYVKRNGPIWKELQRAGRVRINNPRKRRAKKGSYVSRPSQITKRAPSKRLKKRRRKNMKSPHAGFFPNPSRRPILFVITAQKGKGPKMHYDGTKFSQRERVKTFPTMEAAQRKALELLKQFSILRNYSIRIESESLRNPR